MGMYTARSVGGVVGLVALLLALGCGQKASETIAEKAMESALSEDGKKVDVKLDSAGGGFSMSVQDKEGKTQQMKITSAGDADAMSMKVTGGDGTAQDVQVTSSGDNENFTMTIQGDDGPMSMVAGEAATLPADFPKDVPMLPGMKLQMVQTMPNQKAYVVQATTEKPVAEAAAFFKQQAAAQGWTEQMAMNQGGMQMLTYEKSDRSLSLMLHQDGANTVVQVTTAMQ